MLKTQYVLVLSVYTELCSYHVGNPLTHLDNPKTLNNCNNNTHGFGLKQWDQNVVLSKPVKKKILFSSLKKETIS